MSTSLKLYMLLLGCKPADRLTEQHDVFFGIGAGLEELIPQIRGFWPEAGAKLHIDAWRPVTVVDGFALGVLPREASREQRERPGPPLPRLFFVNLGGYKPEEFDEFHYKLLIVALEKAEAMRRAKETAFYRHTGFQGAESHIDDRYGVDVDDVYEIQDILPQAIKERYALRLMPAGDPAPDPLRLGYFQLHRLKNLS